MESIKLTDQETIQWLQDHCTHLRDAATQTNVFLKRAYGKIEEQEKQIAELTAQQVEKESSDARTYREAVDLATALFKKHFANDEHYASGRVVWEVCDSTSGVISQIDNMVSTLVREKTYELKVSLVNERF